MRADDIVWFVIIGSMGLALAVGIIIWRIKGRRKKAAGGQEQ